VSYIFLFIIICTPFLQKIFHVSRLHNENYVGICDALDENALERPALSICGSSSFLESDTFQLHPDLRALLFLPSY